jgi:hypothetical protein
MKVMQNVFLFLQFSTILSEEIGQKLLLNVGEIVNMAAVPFVITLAQTKSIYIDRMIRITGYFYLVVLSKFDLIEV